MHGDDDTYEPRTGDAYQGRQDEPTSGLAMQERDADDD